MNQHVLNSVKLLPLILSTNTSQKLVQIWRRPRVSFVQKQLQSMFLTPIGESEVEKLLMKLKNETSVGSDGLPNRRLNLAALVLIPSIAKLSNRCIHGQHFPSVLRVAKIIPVYEEGHSNIFETYRPIALLSPFEKHFNNFSMTG